MQIPTTLQELKEMPLNREMVKEALSEIANFARLAMSGKPMISIKEEEDGSVSLTEGYFGNKTAISGLRFEDLPYALEQRIISQDAAMEAFRFMMKKNILLPANENESAVEE